MNSLLNDITNSFLDVLIHNLSSRLSIQLHINKQVLIKAIKDETFVLPLETILKNEVDEENEKEDENDKNEDENEDENEEQSEEEDNGISQHFIFDFKDKTYYSDEDFWKHKGIKLDGSKYRLHLKTNLILDSNREDNQLYVIGLMNKEGEFYDKSELPKVVKEWCKIHSLLLDD
jgi:hypothetical protein